jgi:hypothetical protein
MADDFDFSNLFNITYDANGNMLFDGVPIANTPSFNLDNTNIVNSAGQAYVPAGSGSSTGGSPTLDVDYTDAIAMLNSPFANTAVFDSSDLDGFDDVTGDPSLFEDLLLQGADTRIGLNEAANTLPLNQSSTVDGGAGNDFLKGREGIDGGAGNDTIDIFKSNTDLSGNALSQISGLTDNLRIGLQDAQVTQNADGTFLVTTRDGSVIQYQSDGSNPVLISDTNYDNSSLASSIIGDTNSENYGSVTIDDLADYLTAGGLGSGATYLREGSATPEEIAARYLTGDRLTGFQNLMKNFDRSTIPEFTGNYTYNPNNPSFGAETGRNQVYYIDPTTNKPAMGLASEVNALYPGITTYNSPMDLSQQNPGSFDNTTTDNTGDSGIDFEGLYYSLLNQQNEQNQPQTDYSGLMGLLNQFMQSRNSLQGGGRYNNMYGTMYGGGMGYGSPYGNPFNSGMGYGYGMNPYAGGIGSFYGNTGLGFSPSGYNSGYGSGYGMNNMFYGGFGGNNYNQQQQMAYNPYSSLYNQLSNPQTYGYSGDVYTPEYNSYLNTQYEGDRYSQGYQDYLQSNNPSVYNNLFGGSV